jgi:FKBP-type peptidyl-prolyl cis-trans isomerase
VADEVKRVMPKNKITMKPIFAAAMLTFFAILAAQAFCQSTDGTLTGIVWDRQNKVVVGAIVSIKNKNADIETIRATDRTGNYVFWDVRPGNYTVTVDAPGFARWSQDYQISIGGQGVLNVQLGVKLPEPIEDFIPDNRSKDLQLKQEEKLKLLIDKNKKEGDAFQLKNKAKEGVMIIPNSGGVQYKILVPGNGPKPLGTNTVMVSYIGKMADGKEFENKSNQQISIPLSRLNNPGLKTALLLMPVGSQWEVVIPPEAAYGEKGHGPIEPNATAIFEITLIGIQLD